MGKFTEDLDKQLRVTESSYSRLQLNSYMNTFEWENVADAGRIAQSLEKNKSLFYFPFIRQTLMLLWITAQSISAANKYDSKYKILASEYGLMAVFINFFNILEFIPKGIAGFFARRITHENNQTNMQKHFAKHAKKYSDDLETIPFYDQDYRQKREDLSKAYQSETSVTLTDRLTYHVMRFDWLIRSWVSKPLQYLYHQPDNVVPPTTDMIVRYRMKNVAYEHAKDTLKEKLSELKDTAKVNIVNDHVYVKPQRPDKEYISTYALISCPRYREFINTCKALDEADISIRKIAGNDQIQVKCDIRAENQTELHASYAALRQVEHAKPLYFYGDAINSNRRICLFDVPVKALQKTVRELDNAHKDATVSFIHNF